MRHAHSRPLGAFTLAAVPLLALGSAALAGGAESLGPAELVLTHGRIYTVDGARSWAEALAVRAGRLVYVGTDAGAKAFVGPATRQVDAGGRLVLPGFHDSHVHPVSAGIELGLCDLNGAKTVDEVRQRVLAYAATHPDKPWIVGGGWDLPLFPAANPKKELLDALIPDRPAVLSSADGHSTWVNSKALAAAGISRETPDPGDGRVERDPATGEATGTLRESASRLVSRLAPEPSAADYRAGLERALRVMNGFGIVAFQEASADDRTLETYAEADREGRLTARVRVSLATDPAKGPAQVERLSELRRAHQGRRYSAGTAKIFVDGVIEAQTAALLEPYLTAEGKPAERPGTGLPRYTPEGLNALVARLDAEGFQVHMHAIGDRAIRMGLDAVEAARKANGVRDARHQMAHIQLFDPADIPRFRRLGVVANFQPLWAYADTYITDLTEPFLGPQRSRWLYPIRSLMASGAVVAAGSDWSVSSVSPIDAIQVAVTRRGLLAGPGPGWIPEEVVDLPQILAAYTIGSAYVCFEERDSGSLEVGKLADFIVLDKNLFEIPREDIHTARVLWTVLEGREVHRAEGWR